MSPSTGHLRLCCTVGIERGGTLCPLLLAATTMVVSCSHRGCTGLLLRRSCSLPRPGRCREHDPSCRCNVSSPSISSTICWNLSVSSLQTESLSVVIREMISLSIWPLNAGWLLIAVIYPSFQFVSRVGLEHEWNRLYKTRCVSDDCQVLASFLASLAKSDEVEVPVHSRSDVPWSPFGCSWSEPWGSLEHRRQGSLAGTPMRPQCRWISLAVLPLNLRSRP